MRRLARCSVVVLAALTAAHAEPPRKTFVSLSGSADDHPRLGNPAIRVEVLSASAGVAEGLSRTLVAELAALVHARPETGDAPFDYRLEVRVVLPSHADAGEALRFDAVLDHPERGIVWRTEGWTELGGGTVDEAALVHISRNLVSALAHDRWVVRKDDPDDPPPAPPSVLKTFP
jgi:hypothetical protein